MIDDRPLYPVDPWRIRELAFDASFAARNETIFALANGHLGMRGNLEEEAGNVVHGTYVNGFYEEAPIAYGEAAYGYARNHQVLLNVADGKRLQLFVGDEPLDLSTGSVEAYERSLDLRTGILARTVRWRAPGGTTVEVVARRLVSLSRPAIAAIDLGVTRIDGDAPLRIVSAINGRVSNQEASNDPRLGAHLPEDSLHTVHHEAHGPWGAIVQRTRTTRLAIVAATDHRIGAIAGSGSSGVDGRGSPEVHGHGSPGVHGLGASAGRVVASSAGESGYALTIELDPPIGGTVAVTKLLAYGTSHDHPEDELVGWARDELAAVPDAGFEALAAEQREAMDAFWARRRRDRRRRRAPAGRPVQRVQRVVLRRARRPDRAGGEGPHGRGLRRPPLLGHRGVRAAVPALHPARGRALPARVPLPDAQRGPRSGPSRWASAGALYPWRTIGGEEASAYFPAGTAQYHINADIAHAIEGYLATTGDRSFLVDGGAEIVFETARLWASLGGFVPGRGGAFCINEVTGPDEYSALVNNNLLHER